MKFVKHFVLPFLFLAFGIGGWLGSKIYYNYDAEKFNSDYVKALKRDWEENKVIFEEEIDQLNAENRDFTNKITSCITQKTEPITNETKAILYTIKNYHSEIEIPETVTSYYDNTETPSFSVFNYERKDDGLWFGMYIGYRITMITDYDNIVLHFSNSAGRAATAFGTLNYNTISKEVTATEYSYGTGAGGTTLYLNGVKVKETFQSFTND